MSINIYYNSDNQFGRSASNFVRSPFVHPRYGKFESMEGYWHFVRTGFRYGALKNMWGLKAKSHGKTLSGTVNHDFRRDILDGIILKVIYNRMAEELVSTYPEQLVQVKNINGVPLEYTDGITAVLWTEVRMALMNNYESNPVVSLIESIDFDEDINEYAQALLAKIKSHP